MNGVLILHARRGALLYSKLYGDKSFGLPPDPRSGRLAKDVLVLATTMHAMHLNAKEAHSADEVPQDIDDNGIGLEESRKNAIFYVISVHSGDYKLLFYERCGVLVIASIAEHISLRTNSPVSIEQILSEWICDAFVGRFGTLITDRTLTQRAFKSFTKVLEAIYVRLLYHMMYNVLLDHCLLRFRGSGEVHSARSSDSTRSEIRTSESVWAFICFGDSLAVKRERQPSIRRKLFESGEDQSSESMKRSETARESDSLEDCETYFGASPIFLLVNPIEESASLQQLSGGHDESIASLSGRREREGERDVVPGSIRAVELWGEVTESASKLMDFFGDDLVDFEIRVHRRPAPLSSPSETSKPPRRRLQRQPLRMRPTGSQWNHALPSDIVREFTGENVQSAERVAEGERGKGAKSGSGRKGMRGKGRKKRSGWVSRLFGGGCCASSGGLRATNPFPPQSAFLSQCTEAIAKSESDLDREEIEGDGECLSLAERYQKSFVTVWQMNCRPWSSGRAHIPSRDSVAPMRFRTAVDESELLVVNQTFETLIGSSRHPSPNVSLVGNDPTELMQTPQPIASISKVTAGIQTPQPNASKSNPSTPLRQLSSLYTPKPLPPQTANHSGGSIPAHLRAPPTAKHQASNGPSQPQVHSKKRMLFMGHSEDIDPRVLEPVVWWYDFLLGKCQRAHRRTGTQSFMVPSVFTRELGLEANATSNVPTPHPPLPAADAEIRAKRDAGDAIPATNKADGESGSTSGGAHTRPQAPVGKRSNATGPPSLRHRVLKVPENGSNAMLGVVDAQIIV